MLYLEDLNSGQIVRGVTIKNPLRAGDVTLGGFLESGGDCEKKLLFYSADCHSDNKVLLQERVYTNNRQGCDDHGCKPYALRAYLLG